MYEKETYPKIGGKNRKEENKERKKWKKISPSRDTRR